MYRELLIIHKWDILEFIEAYPKWSNGADCKSAVLELRRFESYRLNFENKYNKFI